jgi:hypothetical protein
MTYQPVFLPLMVEPQPDTAERVRRQVQAIEFAFPRIERLEYVGKPVFFRIKDDGQKCP